MPYLPEGFLGLQDSIEVECVGRYQDYSFPILVELDHSWETLKELREMKKELVSILEPESKIDNFDKLEQIIKEKFKENKYTIRKLKDGTLVFEFV